MNVSVEAVDAGGRTEVFGRAADTVPSQGPITRSLAERIDGSSQDIFAAGQTLGRRSDGAADARTGGGEPLPPRQPSPPTSVGGSS
jgi:hypothetical protein